MFVLIRIMLLGVLMQNSASLQFQTKYTNPSPKPSNHYGQHSPLQPEMQESTTAPPVSRFKCTCFAIDYFLNSDDFIESQESFIATDNEADERSCEKLVAERLEERGISLSMSQLKEYCMSCICIHNQRNLVLMKVVAYAITWCLFMLIGLLAIVKFAPARSLSKESVSKESLNCKADLADPSSLSFARDSLPKESELATRRKLKRCFVELNNAARTYL